ncbi:MAG: polysaccharide lyase family 8 super-sandwich domain-containing protein [Ginsengibacter sp.]
MITHPTSRVNLLFFMAVSFLSLSGFITPRNTVNDSLFEIRNTAGRQLINPDLETVRKRIVNDLLQPLVNTGKIKQLIETIQPDGNWTGINYKDTTKTGFQHSIHLENMLDLARAYKKPGGPYYKNAAVKKTVSVALDFWIAHDFICENWWWNEMGTPNYMINTLLILDTELTEKQRTEGARIASRASFTEGVGPRPGGDFVPIAGMVCKQALFLREAAMLQHAIDVMVAQVVITDRRGINPDMGFHHRLDNVTSIHTYGTSYVSSFAYWAVKLAGTQFTLPDSALKLLIDYYLDGICKATAFAIYPDPGAENRDLSRKNALHASGTEIPENLLMASDYRKEELQNIIQIRKGKHYPNLVWDKYFWHSSYFAHQRKNYFTSARMYSSRQNNVEEPYNEESLKMHHLADGSNFISRTGREYVNIFPVWDWQKIPGATIVQKPLLPSSKEIAKKGLTDFVGGVTNGEFGAAAFDFRSVHDLLTARKAWFFFDREYVCLGADIHSEEAYPVVTTLNQSLLKSKVVVKMKDGVETLMKDQHFLNNVSWVLQDSVAYVFPNPISVHLSNTAASGDWKDITHQSWAMTEPVVKKEVFSLWIDHGTKPQNSSYKYIVVPGIDSKSLNDYVSNSKVRILSNTPEIQAVQHSGLNLTQIVFYKPGSLKIQGGLQVTVEEPCILMLKTSNGRINEIAVSDPTQKLKSLEFSINALISGNGDNWHVGQDKGKKSSAIKVDLPKAGFAGNSVVMILSQ